jgi:hypothetical protein
LSLGVYKYENYRLLEGGLDVSFGGFTWFFFFCIIAPLVEVCSFNIDTFGSKFSMFKENVRTIGNV